LVEISESAENLKVRPNVSDLKFAKLLTGIFIIFCGVSLANCLQLREPGWPNQ